MTSPLDSYDTTIFPFAPITSGDVLAWSPKRVAHRRITGRGGSGKTTIARSFLDQALRAGWTVAALSTRHEFDDFAERPDAVVATEPIQQREEVHALWTLMRQRFAADPRDRQHAPVLIVLDELTHVVEAVRRSLAAQNSASAASFREELLALLRLGRQCRMHVVVTMSCVPAGWAEGLDDATLIDAYELGRHRRP